MKTITLTDNEERELKYLLLTNPCESGCAYTEMEKSEKDCDECKLTEGIDSLTHKIY